MKISYNWLKQFLNIDWEAEKIGELLTNIGLEVEGITIFESVKGGLKGVVVGEILKCEPHPNADRLKVTSVDIGDGDPLQIVCGAPNVARGQKVAVAVLGTILYGNEDSFKIKKAKIRGVESFGMICAKDELGLGENHCDGIMILKKTLPVGTPVSNVFNVETDEIFEIGLTPNRADAMSHYGVARDLRAALIQKGFIAELVVPNVDDFTCDDDEKIEIIVEAQNSVPRYAGVVIKGVEIAESPDWMQKRLRAIGLTPINNLVDVTNYVLHELGQPLHAFDLDKIQGDRIVLKTLLKDTKFITLDGVERSLDIQDLMVCDGDSNPICIAGVFGGKDSGISENTRNIFLESAYFDSISVRRSAKRHGLNTDASFRFERGIDIEMVTYALKRAALLIQQIAGGTIGKIIDIYNNSIKPFEISLSFPQIDRLIGEKIPRPTIENILKSLDICIKNIEKDTMYLSVPSYRVDVQRAVDVIEEILRIYGYNKIEFSDKLNISIINTSNEHHKIENKISNYLVGRGFYEMMANSLTKSTYLQENNDREKVFILNPLSSDLLMMRQSLLFGGLESIAYNINRKNKNLQLFEFGNTYQKFEGKYEQKKCLALFASGNYIENSWYAENKKYDFFYLKAIVLSLMQKMGIEDITTKSTGNQIFAEAIALYVGKIKLAELGVIASDILKIFDIVQPVFYADLNWEEILKFSSNKKKIIVKPLPKYPEVHRDLALLIDNTVTFENLYKLAFQTERKFLKKVDLFDVYQGENLPKGKKSYALSFVLQDESKTLKDAQIDEIMFKLQQSFEKHIGAILR